jgi:hypothetical protein
MTPQTVKQITDLPSSSSILSQEKKTVVFRLHPDYRIIRLFFSSPYTY